MKRSRLKDKKRENDKYEWKALQTVPAKPWRAMKASGNYVFKE